MARFCKFRAKTLGVAHPLAISADPPRYAGMRRKANAHEFDRHCDRYEPCDDVLPLEWSIEKAAQKGDGVILATCAAKSLGEAIAIFAAAVADKPAPRRAEKESK